MSGYDAPGMSLLLAGSVADASNPTAANREQQPVIES